MHADELDVYLHMPRSRLSAVLRLVSALCATSDKPGYVTLGITAGTESSRGS